jgi:hypothetical protein
MKTPIPPVLITFAFVCFALVPNTQAVSPPPDGAYPGGNTAEGQAALLSLTTGGFNTAVGFFSLRSDATGQLNTAVGAGTLLANTGNENTAAGAGALLSNTTGLQNTANGAFALFFNTTGSLNTAIGANALISNTTGADNTATGFDALASSGAGLANTANGCFALSSDTTGNSNTATGFDALFNNTTGYGNTANGFQALPSNTTGYENTANGFQALHDNTGAGNTALGYLAGSNLTTGDDNIDIGNDGVAGDAGTIRIGRSFIGATYIAGIRGKTTGNADAIPVLIDSAGQLGTVSSSRRFKKEIRPMDTASDAILALKPVTFHYKSDKRDTPQFGLIAEEVAAVNPNLVVRDEKGDIYTVRYDAVNAMLLNEFLKEHKRVQGQGRQMAEQAIQIQEQNRKLEEQETIITQLKEDFQSKLAEQQKQIEALTSGLQKVSAQMEMNRLAPQVVRNQR